MVFLICHENLAESYNIVQILIEDVRMLGSFKSKTLSWWTVNFLSIRKHDMARKYSTDERDGKENIMWKSDSGH